MKRIKKALLNILFPRVCVGCGSIGQGLCIRCQTILPYTKYEMCLYCRRASLDGFTHPTCKRQRGIDLLNSLFYYDPLLKQIIKTIKYRLATALLAELFESAFPTLEKKMRQLQSLNPNIILQPVPLHTKRLKTRGFNQATLIANYLSDTFDIAQGNFIKRVKETNPQAQLPHGSVRSLNIKGAFDIVDSPQHMSVLLVDDVVTTGATVMEAARVLKRHGAEKVFVFALAKG